MTKVERVDGIGPDHLILKIGHVSVMMHPSLQTSEGKSLVEVMNYDTQDVIRLRTASDLLNYLAFQFPTRRTDNGKN